MNIMRWKSFCSKSSQNTCRFRSLGKYKGMWDKKTGASENDSMFIILLADCRSILISRNYKGPVKLYIF